MALKHGHWVTLDGISVVSTVGACDMNNKVTRGCYVYKLTLFTEYFTKYFSNGFQTKFEVVKIYDD